MRGNHRTYRRVPRAAVWAGTGLIAAALLASGLRWRSEVRSAVATGRPSTPPERALLLVDTRAGPLLAVVATGGSAGPAVMTVPAAVSLTIPGQGDGRVKGLGRLPGPEVALAISNLLGVWIPHEAITDAAHLAAVVDRARGVQAFGQARSGAEIRRMLGRPGSGAELEWQETLRGLFEVAAAWRSDDFLGSDDPGAVAVLLQSAKGASVVGMPTNEAAAGFLLPDPDTLTHVVAARLGGPPEAPIPVIVLNGSGTPGVGRSVAERLVPGGFRVTVSQNASSFDHDTTLVVAGSSADRTAADRVRELLGVGTVSVAGVPSSLGDVTIVVGRDYQTG